MTRRPIALLLLACWLAIASAIGAANESGAVQQARTALAAAEAERDDLPLGEASALEKLASALGFDGRAEAETLLRRALAIREQVQGHRHRDVGDATHRLGMNLYYQKRYEEAETLLLQALAIRESWHGPDTDPVADSLDDLGRLYYFDKRYDKALAVLERALSIHRRSQRPFAEESVIGTLEQLSRSHRRRNDLAAAETVLSEWLERATSHDGENLALEDGLLSLADIYRETGRLNQADALVERRLSIFESAFGSDSREFETALRHHATSELIHQRHDRSETLRRRLLPLVEAQHGSGSMEYANALRWLAHSIAAQQRHDEAETLLMQALALAEQVLGKDAPGLAPFLVDLGEVRIGTGQPQSAVDLIRQGIALLRLDEAADPRDIDIAENPLERARHAFRAKALGPRPLPGRFASDGIVYISGNPLPQNFDLVAVRVDRATVDVQGEHVAILDLADIALASEARSLLFRGISKDEEMCVGMVAIEHGLPVYFENADGQITGIQFQFSAQESLVDIWNACRYEVAPDPE